ncbi:MAG: glucuronate isomerase [Planctomycetes bacterium]|nr:glucuronate isomerase [Planctomycetota bacterium]
MDPENKLEKRLLDEIMSIPVIDVHSHVPFEAPYAASLRELLGYHYFTELAHSAGMQKDVIAEDNPDEKMLSSLVQALEPLDNTVQYSWMIELSRELFGFQDQKLTHDNWKGLAESVENAAKEPGRAREILDASSIEKVFLTNQFDDDLDRIDQDMFVPSLRADTLVFEFRNAEVRESLCKISDTDIGDSASLRQALESIVDRFRKNGAASVALSLPPLFEVYPVVESDMDTAVGKAAQGKPLSASETATLQCGILFDLAELCEEKGMPFQLMAGAVRNAYRHGVLKGKDLPRAGDTLHSLLPLFNECSDLTFCVSVLSDSQAQELASYGWIVQNVVVSGHWWYDTIPAYIEQDLKARLQSVPKTKLIGYYSDMYKLEFGLPKFNMYRRSLAKVLAEDFVGKERGTEEEAVDLARRLLRENALEIFDI